MRSHKVDPDTVPTVVLSNLSIHYGQRSEALSGSIWAVPPGTMGGEPDAGNGADYLLDPQLDDEQKTNLEKEFGVNFPGVSYRTPSACPFHNFLLPDTIEGSAH